jgi:hypothetical protein
VVTLTHLLPCVPLVQHAPNGYGGHRGHCCRPAWLQPVARERVAAGQHGWVSGRSAFDEARGLHCPAHVCAPVQERSHGSPRKLQPHEALERPSTSYWCCQDNCCHQQQGERKRLVCVCV